MNPGQEMFYNFFMDRVSVGNELKAKALLEESFEHQRNGTFDAEYMSKIAPIMMSLVKPEALEELKDAMNHFASRI